MGFTGLNSFGWFGRKERSESPFVSPAPSPKERPAITVAVCNQKGGCAKTTTAINLAGYCAAHGLRTLLVDLDPQAHATIGLGLDADMLDRSVYDLLVHAALPETVIRATGCDLLDIMPANAALAGAQLELAHILAGETVLRSALRKLRQVRRYDLCILDCCPTLNLITVNSLAAADRVLVPVQTHCYSLEGMKELFATIDIVRERLNFDLEVLGILPTLFDARFRMNHQALQQIRDYFGELVFASVIRVNAELCEAPFHRTPIHLYSPSSEGAADYAAFADEFLARLGYTVPSAVTSTAGTLSAPAGPLHPTTEKSETYATRTGTT